MLRRILGLAVFAVIVWLVLKVAFGVLGTLIGLAFTVLWLAAIGFVCYVILRVFSPTAADRLRDLIRGGPKPA